MKHPKWKQRAIKAKAELDEAERAERYRKFWEAVYPEPIREERTSPLDYDREPPPV